MGSNLELSNTYKLFNYVCRQNDDQVVRYFQPSIFREWAFVEPLWTAQETRIGMQKVPVCPKCGAIREFELQIMPQLFDKIPQLMMVDWETIVVYSCVNIECLTRQEKDSCYSEEFAFVQISQDFERVKFGNE